MRVHRIYFLALLPLLASCAQQSSSTTSSATPIDPPTYDTSALKSRFGDFSIQVQTAGIGSYTYDEASNTYTLAVAATKATYNISGYFSGKIVIANTSNLSSYKGVELALQNACLVSEDDSPAINYTLEKRNVEVKSVSGTANMVLALGTSNAIYSSSNVEFSGKGNLEMCSLGGNAHTVRAADSVRFYSSPTIYVSYSAHDAFHANVMDCIEDPSDSTSTKFTGVLTIDYAFSQAFDMETSSGKGYVHIHFGTFHINAADSVFKTDKSLAIDSGASVLATNIANEPYVKGDNSSGLTVEINGTFSVNGEIITQ